MVRLEKRLESILLAEPKGERPETKDPALTPLADEIKVGVRAVSDVADHINNLIERLEL